MDGGSIRVLVVDDSLVVRGGIVRMLSEARDIEVVATAADGLVALEKLERCDVDVVLLDIEMPRMDGLAFLTALGERAQRPTVLVLSSLTVRGASVTIEALSRGAIDYITKPTQLGQGATTEEFTEQLRARLRAVTHRRERLQPRGLVRREAPAPQPLHSARPAAAPLAPPAHGTPPRLLAIGASTGGPIALSELLRRLPANLPVPVVIVQHMPPVFTTQLANSLDRHAALTVKEAVYGEELRASVVYIAPGDYHVRVRSVGGALHLVTDQQPPVQFCRPSVDVLFESVADTLPGAALAMVMTGMGSDGAHGAGRLVARECEVWAQDEASSVVWGMPGEVVRRGFAHRVLPLDELAGAVLQRLFRAAAATGET